jgi:hypothetical protein
MNVPAFLIQTTHFYLPSDHSQNSKGAEDRCWKSRQNNEKNKYS